MKKVMLSVLTAMALVSFVSCQSVEDKAIDYCERQLEAIKAKDFKKVKQIGEEMSEWKKTLSDDDRKKVVAATKEWREEKGVNNLLH